MEPEDQMLLTAFIVAAIRISGEHERRTGCCQGECVLNGIGRLGVLTGFALISEDAGLIYDLAANYEGPGSECLILEREEN